MKQRIFYLAGLFLAFLVFFVFQKAVFVYANRPLPLGDLLQVVRHGMGLDASTAGDLLIIPFVLVWGSVWYPGFDGVVDYVEKNAREGDLVITLGCGDIYKAAKRMIADKK